VSAGGLGFGADVFLPGGHYSIDKDGGGCILDSSNGQLTTKEERAMWITYPKLKLQAEVYGFRRFALEAIFPHAYEVNHWWSGIVAYIPVGMV